MEERENNVRMECGQCGKRYRATSITAGKTYRCNTCGAALKITASSPPAATQPGDPSDPLLGKLCGNYLLERLLGIGGMGRVYLAHHRIDDSSAAVKILNAAFAMETENLQRFLRGARMAAKLIHPNIVTLYDVGDENGVFYLAMEYVDGETLQDRLEREKRITIQETLRIHMAVLNGLRSAHQLMIVHRDIKPENIMISRAGEVKITDLGLARQQDPGDNDFVTNTGDALGTPQFMALEQALGEPIDGRTDLYGVGVSLYFSLSSTYPFEGETPIDYLRNMLNEEPVPIDQRCHGVTSKLNHAIMKLLRKEKDTRYRDVNHAYSILQDCLVDYVGHEEYPAAIQQPITAACVTKQPQFPTWLPMLVAGLIILLLLGLLLVLLK